LAISFSENEKKGEKKLRKKRRENFVIFRGFFWLLFWK
jgi:hypothetical protein